MTKLHRLFDFFRAVVHSGMGDHSVLTAVQAHLMQRDRDELLALRDGALDFVTQVERALQLQGGK